VTKQRVYDLAKAYGMSGQELAAKLRDLGFQVKSHMSALDDFQVLEIQARLEAYGLVDESAGQGVSTVGGLKIRRKKKKKKPAPSDDAPAATSAPAEEAPPEPEADAPSDEEEPQPAPRAEAEAPVEEAPAEEAAPVEQETAAEAPAAETAAAETPAEEVAAVEEAPVAEADVEESPAPEATAEDEEAETAEAAADEEPEAATGKKGAEAKKGEEAEGGKADEVVRPSTRRRQGKVVGFIDPSKFQSAPRSRPESRRLRSSDDVVPDVRPTFGRDRHSGQVRGDQTRGAQTTQELRDRENSRFLRRRRLQQQGPGGRRGAGPKRPESTGSPYSGGSVSIEMPITIKRLANKLAVKENAVMRLAFEQLGFGQVNINSLIDEETAVLLAQEFDVELEVSEEEAAEEALLKELEERRSEVGDEELVQRPPTVAFLGHVDHGKTTLIDTIRRSRIASKESGGITQHIGAYQVTTKAKHKVTIVDTPGHAAFTAMRARGAKAVDVVVLVVAADDGVKPQTEEALNHAKAAGVPIVVAVNKMDKPEANAERVQNELAALGLTPEEWGGDTAMLKVSGLKGDGIDELLERVFLESEVLELKSHPKGPASGIVIEAEIQQGKGKVAHLLVQDGSLQKGDVILAGQGYGKVRSIHDDRGKQIKAAAPSTPVEVTGLNELPSVGDHFHIVDSLDRAQEVAEERARHARQVSQIERREVSRENIFEAVAESEKPAINLIVKADVQGSVEVLKHQIGELDHEEMQVKLIHAGVGQVLESDVDLAATSDARVLAFHTSASNKVRQLAERQSVDIKVYEVIYELLDDIKRLMEGELAPEIREEITGHVEIRRIFKSSKIGNIAGCYVLDGTIARSNKLRLLRDGQVVHSGQFASMKRESDDAKEVREGFECGLVLKDYNDIREGDVIETYKLVEIKRTL